MQVLTTMAYGTHDGINYAAHRSDNPVDAEWDQYLSALRPEMSTLKGVLVYTLGGGPTPKQREQIKAVWDQFGAPRIAVMTPSLLIRTAVNGLNAILGGKTKTFKPEQVEAALDYLELTDPFRRRSALDYMQSLRKGLGL